jgi:hypothetical protein
MTSVTMKTVRTPKIDSLLVAIFTPDTTAPRAIFDMLAYVYSQFPSMGDQGLSGYSYYFTSFPNPLDGGNTTVGGMFMSSVVQDSSPEAIRALWDPVVAHIESTWPGMFKATYIPESLPSFLAWFSKYFDSTDAGKNGYIGSRLLDRNALTGDLAKSSKAWEGFANGTTAGSYLVSGKGVHDAKPRGCGNAVLPAWRRAYVHAGAYLSLFLRYVSFRGKTRKRETNT